MSLKAASVELAANLKALEEAWRDTRAVWADGVAQEFEERYWELLVADVRDALGAIDRLSAVLARARRDAE
jgi:hypothetical protein